MEHNLPDDVITQKAADDIVEFALMAFGPDYLLWDALTNAALATFAWNAGHPAASPVVMPTPFSDARMDRLLRVLCEARRTRWGDRTFEVADLRSQVVDGEIVFTFRLTWDGGQTYRPCRIVVDAHETDGAAQVEPSR
ncbi:MAG: hypothetical protein ACC662_07365 [Planctomycetota bacterium]